MRYEAGRRADVTVQNGKAKKDKKQKVGSRKVNPPASTTYPLVQGKELSGNQR